MSIQNMHQRNSNAPTLDEKKYGIVEDLLKEKDITDVLINGCNPIWIDRGKGLEETELQFFDEASLRTFAQKFAFIAGRRLDQSHPYVDAQVSKTIRFHCLLSPVAFPGTLVSFRIHQNKTFNFNQLIFNSTITQNQSDFIKKIVIENKSFVICGGTGSGKTTILNSILSQCSKNQRIAIIEDSRELNPDHPHTISLEARPANIEGKGLITMRELIKQSLRMRADRLIIGEVRGDEVIDWLGALNTGHIGSIGTIHANSINQVVSRFETLGIAAGLSRETLHSQLKGSFHYAIHINKDDKSQRKVTGIGEFKVDNQGQVYIEQLNI
jgi:pilus assembly protein CpaF